MSTPVYGYSSPTGRNFFFFYDLENKNKTTNLIVIGRNPKLVNYSPVIIWEFIEIKKCNITNKIIDIIKERFWLKYLHYIKFTSSLLVHRFIISFVPMFLLLISEINVFIFTCSEECNIMRTITLICDHDLTLTMKCNAR